jgi:hypothetical protein
MIEMSDEERIRKLEKEIEDLKAKVEKKPKPSRCDILKRECPSNVKSCEDCPVYKTAQTQRYNYRTFRGELYSPSKAWYILPFLLGFIGGLIGYIGVKDRDEGMAESLLLLGILMTFIMVVIGLSLIGII